MSTVHTSISHVSSQSLSFTATCFPTLQDSSLLSCMCVQHTITAYDNVTFGLAIAIIKEVLYTHVIETWLYFCKKMIIVQPILTFIFWIITNISYLIISFAGPEREVYGSTEIKTRDLLWTARTIIYAQHACMRIMVRTYIINSATNVHPLQAYN